MILFWIRERLSDNFSEVFHNLKLQETTYLWKKTICNFNKTTQLSINTKLFAYRKEIIHCFTSCLRFYFRSFKFTFQMFHTIKFAAQFP